MIKWTNVYFEYLKNKLQITNSISLKITHGQIANELGIAREVISRVLKKLESEKKIEQTTNGIILHSGD
ncbi:MAG: helix-turn-helix domain-containing protein [Polaribacter sp.]|uniref:helix-turn-helix domain-containing protein n=1 Tax=Polaribacter sp. TaxID=1920175 RepID=UPI003263B5C9